MNYHSHENRDEVWNVVDGSGIVIVDDKRRDVSTGDVVYLPAGCKHTIIAATKLKVIEVQKGQDITHTDKTVYAMPVFKSIL